MIDLGDLKLKDNAEKTTETNFKDLENKLFLSPTQKIEIQPIALSIGNHQYKGNTYSTPFGSYGDFSCIVGASKSKKTFLKSLLTACYIGGRSSLYASDIKGWNTKDKFVLEFDTEQSKFHVQNASKRVLEMVGATDYDRFRTYFLRELAPKERFQFLEYIFLESEFRDNIGLVTIDGIADLISDINSVEQAVMITDSLLKWTSKSKAHCITILHRNFGVNKPTGHLGSFILKKAETTVFVETNNENVMVKPEYTRNTPFREFEFTINENWLPQVVSKWT